MVQVEIKKEIVLIVDDKEIKLTEEQAKTLLESLKLILDPPKSETVTNIKEKEYVYIPMPYPEYPKPYNPNYPWITWTSNTSSITCKVNLNGVE